MGAVQLNIRLDEELKATGDNVLADHGVSSTEAIRSLWTYMAKTRRLPDFILGKNDAFRPDSHAAEDGAGFAVRMMREKGFDVPFPKPIEDLDQHIDEIEELKEEAYLEKYPSLLEV